MDLPRASGPSGGGTCEAYINTSSRAVPADPPSQLSTLADAGFDDSFHRGVPIGRRCWNGLGWLEGHQRAAHRGELSVYLFRFRHHMFYELPLAQFWPPCSLPGVSWLPHLCGLESSLVHLSWLLIKRDDNGSLRSWGALFVIMSHCVFVRHLLSKNAERRFFVFLFFFMHALWSLCLQGQLLGEIFKQNRARGHAVIANISTDVMRSQVQGHFTPRVIFSSTLSVILV